jgi:hypothetical protein
MGMLSNARPGSTRPIGGATAAIANNGWTRRQRMIATPSSASISAAISVATAWLACPET